MRLLWSIVLCLPWAAACSSTPPPGWAEGGTRLVFGPASWTSDSAEPIELREDGSVVQDGDVLFILDRAGRVFDEDREPIAVLLQDGHVGGNDDTLLGRVGLTNASPPGRATAWLSLLPDGKVMFFDSEGERSTAGVWRGCQGPILRTCTLVTHIIILERAVAASRSNVSFGVGIGVWR